MGNRQRTSRARAARLAMAAAALMTGLLAPVVGKADEAPVEPSLLCFRGEPEVYIPLPPPAELQEEPGVRVRGHRRLEVPGAVTINAPPYVCDLDSETFGDKQSFVAHLRTRHGAELREAENPFVVDGGQVHFIGDR